MDKRKATGIIIIITGLALMAGVIYYLFFYGEEPETETASPSISTLPSLPETTVNTTPAITVPAVIEIKPPTKEEITQEDLMHIAALFAERYGSYSNQSDYGNIEDLKIFMTQKMKGWADDYITRSRAEKQETSIYFGMTTIAIEKIVDYFDEDVGVGVVIVKTQRREATGTTGNIELFYQEATVKFEKEQGSWKVDDIVWGNKWK